VELCRPPSSEHDLLSQVLGWTASSQLNSIQPLISIFFSGTHACPDHVNTGELKHRGFTNMLAMSEIFRFSLFHTDRVDASELNSNKNSALRVPRYSTV
jgi:hypothetical protein